MKGKLYIPDFRRMAPAEFSAWVSTLDADDAEGVGRHLADTCCRIADDLDWRLGPPDWRRRAEAALRINRWRCEACGDRVRELARKGVA